VIFAFELCLTLDCPTLYHDYHLQLRLNRQGYAAIGTVYVKHPPPPVKRWKGREHLLNNTHSHLSPICYLVL